MGRSRRPRPKHMGKKLKAIRQRLALPQQANSEKLGFKTVSHSHISGYESGTREPPYPVTLKYPKLANLSTDVLIDDDWSVADVKKFVGTKILKP